MQTIILIVIILAILGGAAAYIVRAKKRGDKCVGCPYAKQCGATGSSCGCGCSGGTDNAGKKKDQ